MGILSGVITKQQSLMVGLSYTQQSERKDLRDAPSSKANKTFQFRLGTGIKAEEYISDNVRLDFETMLFLDVLWNRDFQRETLHKVMADAREEIILELEKPANYATGQINCSFEDATLEDINSKQIIDTFEFKITFRVTRS